jgi:hypothetical protein
MRLRELVEILEREPPIPVAAASSTPQRRRAGPSVRTMKI